MQILELTSTYHAFPLRRRSGMSVTAAFCAIYLLWIFFIAFFGGFWVYPVFRVSQFSNYLFIG